MRKSDQSPDMKGEILVPLPFRLADCAIINAREMRFDRNSLYLPSRQSRLQFCVCQRRFRVRLRPPFAFASKLLPRRQAKNIFSHRITFIDFMKLLSDSGHVLHCHINFVIKHHNNKFIYIYYIYKLLYIFLQ